MTQLSAELEEVRADDGGLAAVSGSETIARLKKELEEERERANQVTTASHCSCTTVFSGVHNPLDTHPCGCVLPFQLERDRQVDAEVQAELECELARVEAELEAKKEANQAVTEQQEQGGGPSGFNRRKSVVEELEEQVRARDALIGDLKYKVEELKETQKLSLIDQDELEQAKQKCQVRDISLSLGLSLGLSLPLVCMSCSKFLPDCIEAVLNLMVVGAAERSAAG